MLHAELLHDSASIERGKELASLYIEGIHRLRADVPDQEGDNHFKQDIVEAIEEAVEREDMDGAAYEQLGRSIIELRRKQDVMEAWKERGEVGTPEWYAAFGPAFDFLALHAGKPIAAEQTREKGNNISSYRLLASRYPQKLGGYVIPKVAENTGLYISRRPGSENAMARLQVFDRDWSDKSAVSYFPCLKIAIGE